MKKFWITLGIVLLALTFWPAVIYCMPLMLFGGLSIATKNGNPQTVVITGLRIALK